MNPHRDEHAALVERVDRLREENAVLKDELAGQRPTSARLTPRVQTRLVLVLALGVVVGAAVVAAAVFLRHRAQSVDAVPSDGRWHVEHVTWTETSSPGLDVEAVRERYAVGAKGKILYFDDETWVPQASGTTADLHAVAVQRSEVVAVGAQGTVLRFDTDTKAWLSEPSGTTTDLRSVAAQSTSPTTFYAVGSAGMLVVRRPASRLKPAWWEQRDSGAYADLHAVYASSRLVALGANGTLVSSKTGESWTREDTQAPTATFYALLEEPDRSLVVFASDGLAIRSRGASASPWVPVANGASPKESRFATRFQPAARRSDPAHHTSEGATGIDGMVVLLGDRPWFYSARTGWDALPAPPERIARLLEDPIDAPRHIVAVGASGRAFRLGPPAMHR